MKKKSGAVLFVVALAIVGIFVTAHNGNANPGYRAAYDTAHGNPPGTTPCTFCHTSPPTLNSTGQTLLNSNFDYCSIGPATGTCAPAPPAVTAPVISSFTATPASITSGGTSTLAWTLSGGAPTSLTIDNGGGSVLGVSSLTVAPTVTTTYTITTSNSAGTVSQSTTVTVTQPEIAPVISSLMAAPASITSGGSSTLSWTLSGGAPTSLTIDNGVGSVLGLTSAAVSPTTTTTYTITASNSAGTVSQSTTVTVTSSTPPPGVSAPVINSFTATPASITSGGSSTLAWTLSGGAPTSLTIDHAVGSVLGVTSSAVSPAATTTYTITASNSAGTVSQSTTVTVISSTPPPGVSAPVINSFTATPASITSGGSSTLVWTLSGGAPTSLTIDNGVGSVLGLTSAAVSPTATTAYTITASNSAGTVSQTATVTVAGSTPPPSAGPDLSIWVGVWLKVTVHNEGYYDESQKQLSSHRQSYPAYIHITGWDPNSLTLQATMAGEDENDQTATWSEALSLKYISGTNLNFLCSSQMTINDNATSYAFTARIKGIMKGDVLVGGTFTSLAGYHSQSDDQGGDGETEALASGKHRSGWLKIKGRVISTAKVPSNLKQ